MAFHDCILPVALGRSALLIVATLVLCGCAVVGPQSITAGRGTYNEVINRTENEQILNALVHLRYDETFGLMTVASVTANLSFSARISTDIGIGDSDDYSGNLVPLSAGTAYEENPTISYVPLSGQDFTRRMLSPVTIDEWLLIGGPASHPGQVFALAVRRVNGLRNPLLREEPRSPGFTRFVELYDRLRRLGVLDVVRTPKTESEGDYFWDVHDYAPAHDVSVREILKLLGIEVEPDGSAILLPIRIAIGSSASAIHIQTRSAYDVLRVFSNGIELPPDHLEAGIVEPVTSPAPGDTRFIAIRSSEKQPDDAVVQIRFRDRWFYIDSTDTASKIAFTFLRTFIGMRLADPGAAQKAPILTVPVN
jgi:hypothetical protein